MKMLRALSMFTMLLLCSMFSSSQPSSTTPNLIKVAWSPDGTQLAGLDQTSSVTVWDVDDLEQPLFSFQAEIAGDIMWTNDGQYIITQGTRAENEQHLMMSATKWDAATGTIVETLMHFELDTPFDFNFYGYYIFPSLALDTSGQLAAYSYRSGQVYMSDGSTVLHLENPVPTYYVYHMVWNSNSERIAVVYGSSDIYSIQVFDTAMSELQHLIYQDLQYFITDLAWDATGTYLATSSMRYTCCEGWSNVGVYNLELERSIGVEADRWWEGIDRYSAPIAWHPNELIIAIGMKEAIEIYDPKRDQALLTLAASAVQDVAWSPNGQRIAAVLADGALQVWDVEL